MLSNSELQEETEGEGGEAWRLQDELAPPEHSQRGAVRFPPGECALLGASPWLDTTESPTERETSLHKCLAS